MPEWLEERLAHRRLLPADEAGRSLVRERVAWIDQHAFRPMIGVYDGNEPGRIERAGTALAEALEQLGSWADETGWLAGA